MALKSSKYNIFVSHNENYCVVNTMTSAVITLDENEYNALKSGDFRIFSNNQILELSSQGILVDETLDEIALLRHTYFFAKNSDNEANITICPTLDCNFACPYCYETRKKGKMQLDTQNAIIKLIEKLLNNNLKKLYVLWYGGEPLLCPDIVYTLSTSIQSLCDNYSVNCVFSMISNGYLLNDDNINMLSKIKLSKIQITLDGLSEYHDKRRFLINGSPTFEKIVNNIKNASKKIHITVRVNIDRSNLGAYENIQKLFANYNNVDIYCAPVTIEDTQSNAVKKLCYSIKEYDAFYKNAFDLKDIDLSSGINCCAAEMKNTFVIDPEGFAYKCLNDLGHYEWSLKNINDKSQKLNPSVVAKYSGRDPFSEPKCKDCVYLPQCYGGCIWNYNNRKVHSCEAIKYLLVDKIKKEYM